MTNRAILVAISLALATPAPASTFYVDPQSGADTNAGTSAAQPWKTPPGTRLANDSGFLRSTWGAIGTSNRIACGDTILLKGGAVHSSAQGGAWRIDPYYYTTNCTASTPITIQVATSAQWPASSGNFVIDGTGMTPTCRTACGAGGYAGLVDLEDVSGVKLGGASAQQMLEVKNAAAGTPRNAGVHQDASTSVRDIEIAWLYTHDNNQAGIDLGTITNSVVRNSIAENNGGPGFSTGLLVDRRATRLAFVDCASINNGSVRPATGYNDGFFLTGCVKPDDPTGNIAGCWIIRGVSRDGQERGMDAGGHATAFAKLVTIRDSQFYRNGTSTSTNPFKAGACTSGGGDGGYTVPLNWAIFERVIFALNRQAGGTCAYGTGLTEVWNSVFWNNAYDSTANPVGDIAVATDTFGFSIFNSLVQKRAAPNISWSNGAPRGALPGCRCCPISDHNLYRPFSSDADTLGPNCSGSPAVWGGAKTYAPGNRPGYIGSNDKVGSAYRIGFVSTHDSDYSRNDFHLTPGSDAIDAGTYLLRADGGGSNASTINVKANRGLADPRAYFISPASYLGAPGDFIAIQGCGTVQITAMTATSITFTPACSWADNAGVHFPWAGAAPDMGAFEFGTTSVPAPALISVEQVAP